MNRIFAKLIAICTMIGVIIGMVGCAVEKNYIELQSPNIMTDRKIGIWVDQEFTSNDLDSIEDAVAEWNYGLAGNVRLEIVRRDFNMSPADIEEVYAKHGWLILKINGLNGAVVAQPETLAYANSIGGWRIYMIMDRMTDNMIKGIMMHEIGHLLGARHGSKGLMKSHYDREEYKCLDKSVMEKAGNFLGVSINKLRYCE